MFLFGSVLTGGDINFPGFVSSSKPTVKALHLHKYSAHGPQSCQNSRRWSSLRLSLLVRSHYFLWAGVAHSKWLLSKNTHRAVTRSPSILSIRQDRHIRLPVPVIGRFDERPSGRDMAKRAKEIAGLCICSLQCIMAEITTFYLEMRSQNDLKEKEKPAGLDVIEAEFKKYRFNLLPVPIVFCL